MSRKRYVSTNISVDPRVRDLAQQSEFAALLYTWMIPHADDSASITADPEELLMQVVPGFRWRTAEDVASALDLMVSLELLLRVDDRLRFPPESFYKYQAYIGSERRNGGPPPEPAPVEPATVEHAGAKPRKSAQHRAGSRCAPESAQNPASFKSSSSVSHSSSVSSSVSSSLPAANAAGPSHPPPEFSEGERSEIDEIETTLEPFGLHQRPEFWRKVLDTYGELPLGMEALKQADWLRRNNKRIVNVSRYTNWLDKAMDDYRDHAPPALVEVPRRPPHVCTVECEHECFDLECAIHGDATRESIQRRIASHAKGALSA